MPSKLGAFNLQIPNLGEIIANPPRIFKGGDMGVLSQLHDAIGERTVFIARTWGSGDDFSRFDGNIGLRDPIEAAARWWKYTKEDILKASFAYWESFNEMSNWDYMSHYGIFEAERQRILYDNGIKACIGNFATGCPDISEFVGDADRKDYWPEFYPALKACNKYQNLLGLHEYGGLWMWTYYGQNQRQRMLDGQTVHFPDEYAEGWLFGRYRKVWRRHITSNGWTRIRIALTEFGLDRAATDTTYELTKIDGGAGPWRQLGAAWTKLNNRPDTDQFYTDQLRWADSQMMRDPYLVGAAIFSWGTTDETWKEWDVTGNVANAIYARIRNSPYPTNFMVVNNRRGINLRIKPDMNSNSIATLAANEIVEVLSEAIGNWKYVSSQNGIKGYALSKSPAEEEWLTDL